MRKEDINFRDRDILFIDLETTGLDLEEHEIIEIGCLVVNGKNLRIKKRYHTKVKPEHLETASKEGLEVAGYSEKAWTKARELADMLEDVAKLAPGAMIAGWKVDFDWWFLDKAFKKHNVKHNFDYHLIDVISLAFAYYRNQKKPKRLGLRKVAKLMNLDLPDTKPHNAMKDIEATFMVFKNLLDKIVKD